jgi:hypothetical protein
MDDKPAAKTLAEKTCGGGARPGLQRAGVNTRTARANAPRRAAAGRSGTGGPSAARPHSWGAPARSAGTGGREGREWGGEERRGDVRGAERGWRWGARRSERAQEAAPGHTVEGVQGAKLCRAFVLADPGRSAGGESGSRVVLGP